jgi:hypothetical protein
MTPEEIKKLQKRYAILGAFAMAEDSSKFTIWCYDSDGNQLKITAEAGKLITYEETFRKAAPTGEAT